MSSLDITFNVENVKFCPGPCESMTPEPEPIEVNNEKKHRFKPYSGGSYESFCYPMANGGYLFLNNVRMCSGCYHRYQEIYCASPEDDEEMQMSYSDAAAICYKLNKPSALDLNN
jgi:hypothetical protein